MSHTLRFSLARLLIYIAIILVGVGTASAAAQDVAAKVTARSATANRYKKWVPVEVAVIDQPGSATVIFRYASASPHDIIALSRANASAAQLKAAMHMLMVVRELQGDTAKADVAIRVPQAAGDVNMSLHDDRYMAGIVSRLLLARPAPIPGLGNGATEIAYLRPGSMKGRLRKAR